MPISAAKSPIPGTTPRPLAEVLRYQNVEVIRRFCEQFPVSEREAESLFRETKKWLWLCATAGSGQLAVTEPIRAIDEMWHTFLLYTHGYHEFCRRYFGRFLHHAPTTQREKVRMGRRMTAQPEREMQELEVERRRQYETILKYLGEATLRKWYVSFPKKYSTARLHRLQQKALNQERNLARVAGKKAH